MSCVIKRTYIPWQGTLLMLSMGIGSEVMIMRGCLLVIEPWLHLLHKVGLQLGLAADTGRLGKNLRKS